MRSDAVRGCMQGPFLLFATLALVMKVWPAVSCAVHRASDTDESCFVANDHCVHAYRSLQTWWRIRCSTPQLLPRCRHLYQTTEILEASGDGGSLLDCPRTPCGRRTGLGHKAKRFGWRKRAFRRPVCPRRLSKNRVLRHSFLARKCLWCSPVQRVLRCELRNTKFRSPRLR